MQDYVYISGPRSPQLIQFMSRGTLVCFAGGWMSVCWHSACGHRVGVEGPSALDTVCQTSFLFSALLLHLTHARVPSPWFFVGPFGFPQVCIILRYPSSASATSSVSLSPGFWKFVKPKQRSIVLKSVQGGQGHHTIEEMPELGFEGWVGVHRKCGARAFEADRTHSMHKGWGGLTRQGGCGNEQSEFSSCGHSSTSQFVKQMWSDMKNSQGNLY